MDGKVKSDEDKLKGHEKRAIRRSIRALHNAVSQKDLAKVKDLINPELDVNFHYGGKTALQIAVLNGSLDICQELLQHGADVNKYNAEENTLLNMAVWRGYQGICQLLVDNGADLDTTNNHGASPLNTAAYLGSTDLVEMLVKTDCDINSANLRDQSPLITAANKGWTQVVRILIAAKCDLNWRDNERSTALIVAADKGHIEIISHLLDAKCDINVREKYGSSALMIAAKQGHLKVVESLISAGADLNSVDTKGNSAVMEAVKNQHLQIVKCLTAAGCEVNLQESETKQGAIHAAVRLATQFFGPKDTYTDLVQTLIDAGCDVSLTDSAGWTPLYQAAFGGEIDLVELLLKQRAPVDRRTTEGNTILHAAVICNKPQVVDMVLEAGCDVNSPNKKNELPIYTAVKFHAKTEILEKLIGAGSLCNVPEISSGQSPLFCATLQDFLEAVQILISADCDVNACCLTGESPLWMACNKGNDVIVQALLKHPQIEVNGGYSQLPIHAAASQGHHEIAEMLLKAGADVNRLTDLGASALFLAADKNHTQLIELLIQWGANPLAPRLVRLPQPCCSRYRDEHPHLELEPLYAAVKNDNFKIIKMVLFASPRRPYKVLTNLKNLIFRTGFVQEARLSQTTIYQYASFFSAVLRTPMSLQAECRGVIRLKLGCSITEKTNKLPIPVKLKDYIMYKNGFEPGSS